MDAYDLEIEGYATGLRIAMAQAGLCKEAEASLRWPWEEEEPSLLSKLAPWLVGGGLAAGGYKLLRTPMLANAKEYPTLRKIQEMARGEMVRHLPEQVNHAQLPWWERLWRKTYFGPETGYNPRGLINKVHRGSKQYPEAVYSGYERSMPEGTFDPSIGPYTGAEAEKMYDIAGRLEDKLLQSRLLNKYAPGTMAKTLTVRDVLDRYGLQLRRENLKEDLSALQKALKQEFGGSDYVIKMRNSRPGGGAAVQSDISNLPTSASDLFQEHQKFLPIRDKYYKAVAKNPTMGIYEFENEPGFTGRVVEEMLHDNALIQERLKIPQYTGELARGMIGEGLPITKEYRVHTLGGKAMPWLSMPRYAGGWQDVMEKPESMRMAKWVQENVLNKLPEKYRGMSYNFDVVPVEGGGYRVMEMNPQGQSGLLEGALAGNPHLYRTVTGRSTKPMAALMSTGIGAAGAGATTLGQNLAE